MWFSRTLFTRKYKMYVLTVSCLIMILSSCGNRQAETFDIETLDLFEAFFRYKFDNNYSGAQQNAETYFLQIDGEDPTPEFLARFEGHSPPVKKGSEFVMGGSIVEGGGVAEGNGLLFYIRSYKWIGSSKNRAEIVGGYSEGNVSWSGASYTWVKKEGKWELEAAGPILIG